MSDYNVVYVATPYSHDDPQVREQRFLRVNKFCAKLMSEGIMVFSPISHTHPIALAGELPKDWAYWEQYDRTMLCMCGALVVYMQDGWEESTGVHNEIELAHKLKLPIQYVEAK